MMNYTQIFDFTNHIYLHIMNNLDLTELYGRSNNDIIVELGRRFRAYRIALRMTQKDIAEIIPDIPASLYDIQTADNRVKRRVKRRRDEK